jgi:hypothetical protein
MEVSSLLADKQLKDAYTVETGSGSCRHTADRIIPSVDTSLDNKPGGVPVAESSHPQFIAV